MSKTTKWILGVCAAAAVAAAVSYAIYHYLNKSGKKPLAFFKSKFKSGDDSEPIEATDEFLFDGPADDAVDAVDACMPY